MIILKHTPKKKNHTPELLGRKLPLVGYKKINK